MSCQMRPEAVAECSRTRGDFSEAIAKCDTSRAANAIISRKPAKACPAGWQAQADVTRLDADSACGWRRGVDLAHRPHPHHPPRLSKFLPRRRHHHRRSRPRAADRAAPIKAEREQSNTDPPPF